MKSTKQSKQVNLNNFVDKLAQAVACITLVALATYGLRMVLRSLDDTANMVITVVVILALVYITLRNK